LYRKDKIINFLNNIVLLFNFNYLGFNKRCLVPLLERCIKCWTKKECSRRRRTYKSWWFCEL